MINGLDQKVVKLLAPISGTALASSELDTVQSGVKADYAVIYYMFGVIGAGNITAGNFKLQHSDVSGSGFVDIPASGNGTGGTFGVITTTTDDGKIYAINVDTRKTRRYLKVVCTATAATLGCAWAVLERLKEAPSTATTRGVTGVELLI
jgi:hypothetical protein